MMNLNYIRLQGKNRTVLLKIHLRLILVLNIVLKFYYEKILSSS